MNDAMLMRLGERIGNVAGDGQGLLLAQPPVCQPHVERLAINQLHRDESMSLVLADVVDRADVWMRQGRHAARLTQQALARVFVGDGVGRQQFDRDQSLELGILSPVHLRHATRAKFVADFVAAEPGSRCEAHEQGLCQVLAGSTKN